MLGSLAICTVLYILMSSVMTGLVPFKQLNDAAPVAVALESHPQLTWLSAWVIWGALFGLTSVIITMIIPQARIWLTMSHDGLLPKFFGSVHPKFRTPHIATLITGMLGMPRSRGLLPDRHPGRAGLDRHARRLHRGVFGVLVLRYTRPDLQRPFRVKWVWFTAPMGVLFCSVMAGFLPGATWIRLVLWSAIGIALYFAYGYKHSRLRGPHGTHERGPRHPRAALSRAGQPA